MTTYCPFCRTTYHFKVQRTIHGGYVKMGINPDYDCHVCSDQKRVIKQGPRRTFDAINGRFIGILGKRFYG